MSNASLPALAGKRITRRPREEDFEARLRLGNDAEIFRVYGDNRGDLRPFNLRAIRACEKCGFVIEGRERETAFVDDIWHDDVMMAILDHEYAEIRRGKRDSYGSWLCKNAAEPQRSRINVRPDPS